MNKPRGLPELRDRIFFLREPAPNQAEVDRQNAEMLRRTMMERPTMAFVNSRRCAQCWGPMVMRFEAGEWVIVCPKGCQPGGHVSDTYVEWRERQDAIDTAKVTTNYPELNPHKSTPEEREANKRALFGE